MSSIAITVEGTLRKLVGGAPIQPGLDLYFGLATRAKLVLLTGEMDGQGLSTWLLTEGLHEHVKVFYSDVVLADLSEGGERLCQLASARQLGYDVELVIEPDPLVSARLLVAGYNVLTFSHAEYSVPAWRPDAIVKVRPWDELVSQVEREAYLRATDPRKEETVNARPF
jgi:hypothetical protein